MHPQSEEYWGHVNPIGPRACYDEGKRVAETMCYAYMKQVSAASLPQIKELIGEGKMLLHKASQTVNLCMRYRENH